MRKRGVREFKLQDLFAPPDSAVPWPSLPDTEHDRRNRVLFEWLSDDDERAGFYKTLGVSGSKGLMFWSNTRFEDDPAPSLASNPKQGPRKAVLVTDRATIEAILRDSETYSNRAYRALGSAAFMLGLDPAATGLKDWHAVQREAAEEALSTVSGKASHVEALVERAIADAMVIPLGRRPFDLAELAEQIALRWCGLAFGFSTHDHALLQEACSKAYRAITYQILGRHFVDEPDTIPAGSAALARLARRADELIREYDRLDRYPPRNVRPHAPQPTRDLWPEGVALPTLAGLSDFEPILKRWATSPGKHGLSGEQLASMAAGMLAGTVGNVQAAICIAVSHGFKNHASFKSKLPILTASFMHDERVKKAEGTVAGWVIEALCINPPVAFLPRVVAKNDSNVPGGIEKDAELILCMGGPGCVEANGKTAGAVAPAEGKTASGTDQPPAWDPLTFGLLTSPHATAQGKDASKDGGVHSCSGASAAWSLVVRAVTRILLLPGLAERLDPVDRAPIGLEKRWGFACERYPLEHRRDEWLKQQPLQVIMRIKSPVAENAVRLRRAIRDSAPRVQQVLQEARHVHFAWFQLIDNETQLALQTVYDGDFDSYLMHFALKVDDVFDSLLKYLEDAPPLPVRDHPEAFVETMRRFNRAPAGDYFFSAYPLIEVPEVLRMRWGAGGTP